MAQTLLGVTPNMNGSRAAHPTLWISTASSTHLGPSAAAWLTESSQTWTTASGTVPPACPRQQSDDFDGADPGFRAPDTPVIRTSASPLVSSSLMIAAGPWCSRVRMATSPRLGATARISPLKGAHCLSENVAEDHAPMTGGASPNRAGGANDETDQHGCAARSGVGGGGALRIGARREKGRILDELTATTVCIASTRSERYRPLQRLERPTATLQGSTPQGRRHGAATDRSAEPRGGTSVAGSFIQTLTMVDIATGWTECLPLVTRAMAASSLKR